MATTTSGTTTTRYTYDGNDLRLTRATATTINTRYSWDVLNPVPELALERNASNALIRRYVQGPTGPLTMATSATAVFSYHRDHLGTITDLTNTSGAAQWRYAHEPFGAELSATKVVTTAPTNMVRFTGEYQDTEVANLHLRARQYDPTTGRFFGVDPLTPPATDQTVSAYAYVNNMPGVLIDPSGMTGTPAAAPGIKWDVPNTFPEEWVEGTKPKTSAPKTPWHARPIGGAVAGPIAAGGVVLAGGGAILWAQHEIYEDANEELARQGAREDARAERATAISRATQLMKDDDCDCNPFAIRFSQNSVSWSFKDKKFGNIGKLRDKFKSGWNPRTDADFDSIAVTRRGGKWVTLDNRRLTAAQMAGAPIPCRLATDDEVLEAERRQKFSSTNGGSAIDIKLGKGRIWKWQP